ncbi:MAG TPA: hypothetical protein VFQ70_04540, partial [Candidatus Saccharimonadaceae bacterium]|nr:hypothetical protein [Candidatus Saccharimonadaceae bacterium]
HSGHVSTVEVGNHPYCATPSADGKRLFVTNTQSASVSVIDLASKKVLATIGVGEFPEGINYDAASNRLYVANWFDDTVSVIDASNNQLIASVNTGSKSRAFGQFIIETAH